jgi:glycerophosphoryl diester phosphodiesterase
MYLTRRAFAVLATAVTAAMFAPTAGQATERTVSSPSPLVLAHRGASGYIPEHTLAAYALAIEMGADYIEPDLVMTKDGVLVARHENEIGGTTDVAMKFPGRPATTKVIDGASYTGWFTEDFTLAELKTLRCKERIPANRPLNERFNGDFTIPTLQEILDLVKATNGRFHREAARTGEPPRRLGVYPETKHPSYHDSIGLSMEEPLLQILHDNGFVKPGHRVLIQSFEVGNLKEMAPLTELLLIQLVSDSGKPYDFVLAGDPRTYADLITPAGLAEIATYAYGIGANKNLIIPRNPDGSLQAPSALVANAHAAGLKVHGWTFRAENPFLPLEFRSLPAADPAHAFTYGDLAAEIATFLATGMDGFFTDQPNIGVRARDAFLATP